MTATPRHPPFGQLLLRIEGLVSQLERASDPAIRAAARLAVGALLDLHAAGLARMVASVSAAPYAGAPLMDTWLADPTVSGLLILHDLHPEPFDARVRRALDNLTASLSDSSVSIELLDISESSARLQAHAGNRQLSPSRLRELIENTVAAAAPDITTIHIDGLPPAEVHLAQLGASPCGCHGAHAHTAAPIPVLERTVP